MKIKLWSLVFHLSKGKKQRIETNLEYDLQSRRTLSVCSQLSPSESESETQTMLNITCCCHTMSDIASTGIALAQFEGVLYS